MKKFALVAVVFSMVAGVVGCGGSPCDDYVTKYKSCTCDKLTDATAKSTCEAQADASRKLFDAAGSGADDLCQAALDQLNTTCK